MSVTKTEVLKLYRNLITYSRSLKLTDSGYFRRRITVEFKRNKELTDPEEINFAFKENHCCAEAQLYNMLRNIFNQHYKVFSTNHFTAAFKHTIDTSRVPVISESDLEEKFVRGSGPGGSAVNKNSNCVVLTHVPTGTGIVVKSHLSRCQDENRKLAREMLIARLDEQLNGEDSVANQKRRIEERKMQRNDSKKKKKAQLKLEWKKREGLL